MKPVQYDQTCGYSQAELGCTYHQINAPPRRRETRDGYHGVARA